MKSVLEQVTVAIAAEYNRGESYEDQLRQPSDFWQKLDEADRAKWLRAARKGLTAVAVSAGTDASGDNRISLASWIEGLESPTSTEPRPEAIVAEYLGRTPPGRRGINLGCGAAPFAGWLNIDLTGPHADIAWDLTNGLPFLPAGQFDVIYSEHFLEHVPRKSAMQILENAFAALRQEGAIRLALPDLDELIRAYHADDKHPDVNESFREEMGAVFHSKGELFNLAMRAWGHTYMYNREDIHLMLQHVGFVDIRPAVLGQSSVALLQERESRPAYQSALITEATTPG